MRCLTGSVMSIVFALSVAATGAEQRPGAVQMRFHVVPDLGTNPYDRQVSDLTEKLQASSSHVRAGAAEALGLLRAYGAAGDLATALRDRSSLVRRQAAMSLAWCGGRDQIEPLLAGLDDGDWVVRQAVWVSLTNLTGMEWPFDALADAQTRKKQAAVWRRGWAKMNDRGAPSDDIPQLVAGEDNEKRLRGVRALGALGGKGATRVVLETLRPFLDRNYRDLTTLEKHLVQSCIRSLGRLRDPEALPVLLDLIEVAVWARYAADALGDFGARKAVAPLIAAYPSYSRDLNNRTRNPKVCPADDRFSGDNTQDRMHETPYAIAFALARLPLDRPEDIAALKEIVPYVLANLPSDWDSGMLYEPESFEEVTAFLFERAGMRRRVLDVAFEATARADEWLHRRRGAPIEEGASVEECLPKLAEKMYGDVPYMGGWLPALCRDKEDVPRLLGLLDHENGWISINAVKALMFMNAREAIEPIAKRLAASKPEAEWGYSGALEHAEYDDPAPRRREAFMRALGRLGATKYDRLLVEILEDKRNVMDMHHAAAQALDELGTPAALEALQRAEAGHPFHSTQMVAREALWRRGMLESREVASDSEPVPTKKPARSVQPQASGGGGFPEAIVFIKGNNKMRTDFNGQAGVDPWRQTYTVTNSGPTWRVGRNLYIVRPALPDGKVTALTHFEDGFVADCEVSWDGKRVIFSRRLNGDDRNYRQVPYEKAELKDPSKPRWGGPDDPWWHVWEINVDGTGLRQITHGPYHDVQPAYLPDGRIVFSSSRLGMRDEYHGYPSPGLTVMNADGSDIHPIGFNLGGDREPAILNDGRIIFSRLDNFYSRLKTEVTIQAVFPDGTRNEAIYGPERRPFWREIHKKNAAWTMRPSYGGTADNRNRVLRLTQPQPFGDGRIVFASSGGIGIAGPGRDQERMIPHDRKYAVTCPFPLEDGRVLCSASIKQFDVDGRIVTAGTREFERLNKGPELFRSAINIDLGIYAVDVNTGEMTLVYNDPETADFEARPIMPRPRPRVLSEHASVRGNSYTARLFCNSAKVSRKSDTSRRGKLVRVVEGKPFVSRHETQQNRPTNRWKNHGGTIARILGTAPLAADGSFFVEVPADRLLHLQVLDSDRRVVGNQIFWMYARPGETRSCVGCHENRGNTMLPNHFAPTAKVAPIEMLPAGDEFSYRAKAWLKGALPDEAEERNRTVRAVNLLGRY